MNEKIAQLKDRLYEALALREKKAADLVKDLNIPKSAISQYLSGKSQNMDSERMYSICKYLNVSEPWLLGYDVPMERKMHEKNDTITDAVVRMRTDEIFLSVVEELYKLDSDKLSSLLALLK